VTQPIDAAELGARIRHHRLGLRRTVRQAAREAQVSPATFSRVERGDHLPGRENLLRLADWAGIKLKDLQVGGGPEKPRAGSPARSVPEKVALHLRADRDLRPADAEMLADLFRTAYETLRRRTET
jgi:transcriptional regulator with XRE-family HTH domain